MIALSKQEYSIYEVSLAEINNHCIAFTGEKRLAVKENDNCCFYDIKTGEQYWNYLENKNCFADIKQNQKVVLDYEIWKDYILDEFIIDLIQKTFQYYETSNLDIHKAQVKRIGYEVSPI